MKKHIVLIIGLVVLLSGCDLEETIYGTIDDNSFWKTEKDIREGLNAAYGKLSVGYSGFSIWQYVVEDGGTDYNASSNPYNDFFEYSNWSSTAPDGIDWGIYKHFWSQISYINKTLDKIPSVEMNDESKARYTGEGRALRAFLYFTLVQWFRDIPLVTSSTDDRYSIPQESPETIYAFLEKELTECQDGMLTKEELQAAGETGYVHLTKGAAQGLLARVYLVQQKYNECRIACEALLQHPEIYGKYDLMKDYKAIFRTKGYANEEALWALAADGTNNVSLFQVYMYKLWDIDSDPMGRDNSYDIYYDWSGDFSVTPAFYRSFEENDMRRSCLAYNEYCDPDRVMVTKYPAETADKINSSNDFPVIRWADVLLMYAESLLLGDTEDVSGAVEWVNKVRERAGASLYDAADFSSAESFRMKIYQERRQELFMEGCGKRDMLRFGTLLDYIKQKSKDAGSDPERYYYLPIPASALTANPALKQNSSSYK